MAPVLLVLFYNPSHHAIFNHSFSVEDKMACSQISFTRWGYGDGVADPAGWGLV